MMQGSTYRCAFWTMQKPAGAGRGGGGSGSGGSSAGTGAAVPAGQPLPQALD